MQAPPFLESSSITYQIPRNVLIRIWWRRMMFRPRLMILTSILIILGITCLILGNGSEIVGYFLIVFAIVAPFNIYRAVSKAIDDNSQWTDRKTLDFSPSRLVATGPSWKSELPWTHFKGFSEDDDYFYLHLSNNGLASVVPKSAFTSEQQQRFRQCASTLILRR